MRALHLVPLLLSLMGCTSFPDLEEGRCGNFVLDPGEDCDSSAAFSEGGCGAVSSEQACFQVCDSEGLGCPSGWGCGADLRCRQASGSFEPASDGIYPFQVEQFVLGDVDGDGNLDMIGNQSDEVHVLFGDLSGKFSGEIEISTQNPLGPMVFGKFDEDERLDVVVPTEDGVLVLLGSAARTLNAKTFVSTSLGNTKLRVAAIEVADNDVSEVVVVSETLGRVGFQDSTVPPIALGTGLGSSLAGSVAVVDLRGDAAQEFIVPIVGASSLGIYEASGALPRDGVNTLAAVLVQDLLLPVDTSIQNGVQLLDYDGDGDTDLLLSLSTSAGPSLFVALNTPKADPDQIFDSPIPFVVGGLAEQRRPLAIADLNKDSVPDFVMPDGIYISNFESSAAPGPIKTITLRVQAGDRLWDSAVIGDFNGDGRLDVGAGSSDKAEVNIVLGLGNGVFNAFVVESIRRPKDGRDVMVVGDFDGDFVDDLAFAGVRANSEDTLEVIYGATSGGFESPVSMGELGEVQQILSVRTANSFGVADGINDIIVLSEAGAGLAMAQLRGSSARRMVSPYVLSHLDVASGKLVVEIPSAIVTGDFAASAEPHTDIIAIARAPAVADDVGGTTLLAPSSVWLIPGLEGGNLDAVAKPTSFAGQGLFREDCAKWVAGNIDGGLDELIGIDGSDGCYRSLEDVASLGEAANLSLLVARPPEQNAGPFVLEPYELSNLVTLNNPQELQLIDFDNDGAKDLLSIFSGDPFAGDQSTTSGTVLFWNVNGDFVEGRVDTEVGDYATNLRSIRGIHLDGDGYPDWAVVADDGIYTASFIPDTKLFTRPTLRVPVQGARLVEVGDVNRDGVDDIVVLFGAEVKVLLGVAAAPVGGRI